MGNNSAKEEVVIAQTGATAGIQETNVIWSGLGWVLAGVVVTFLILYCIFRRCWKKAEQQLLQRMGLLQTKAFEAFYTSRFSFRRNRDPEALGRENIKSPTKVEIY